MVVAPWSKRGKIKSEAKLETGVNGVGSYERGGRPSRVRVQLCRGEEERRSEAVEGSEGKRSDVSSWMSLSPSTENRTEFCPRGRAAPRAFT